MQCPKCNDAMEPRKIETLEIDVCSNCAGIWFDQDELRDAKDKTDPHLSWMDFEIWKHADQFKFSQQATKCPACQVSMVKIDYANTGVDIDYCPQCRGTWLDEGKFTNIIGALESEAANRSLPDYLKSSLEEAKAIIIGPESSMSEWKDLMTVLKMFQYRFFVEHPDLQDTITGIQKGFR